MHPTANFDESEIVMWDMDNNDYDDATYCIFTATGDDMQRNIPCKSLAMDITNGQWQRIGFLQFLSISDSKWDDVVSSPVARRLDLHGAFQKL